MKTDARPIVEEMYDISTPDPRLLEQGLSTQEAIRMRVKMMTLTNKTIMAENIKDAEPKSFADGEDIDVCLFLIFSKYLTEEFKKGMPGRLNHKACCRLLGKFLLSKPNSLANLFPHKFGSAFKPPMVALGFTVVSLFY